MDKIYHIARKLRKESTLQERKLWNILKNRQFYGFKFRRQFPIDKYVVDFVCESKKIILEIDGGQHNEGINLQEDAKRLNT